MEVTETVKRGPLAETLQKVGKALEKDHPLLDRLKLIKTWNALLGLVTGGDLPLSIQIEIVENVGRSRYRGKFKFALSILEDTTQSSELRRAALKYFTRRNYAAESLIIELLDKQRDHELVLNLIFALRSAGSRRSCSAILSFAAASDAAVRAAVAEVIGDLGCSIPDEVARALLCDEDANVRSFAALTVGMRRLRQFSSVLEDLTTDNGLDSFGSTVGQSASSALRMLESRP